MKGLFSLVLIMALLLVPVAYAEDGTENAPVIATYESEFGKVQGVNNFWFCQYKDDVVTELNYVSESNRWMAGDTFPIVSADTSATPANDADSNLKFISPMKGTVSLKGKIGFSQWRKPGEGGNGVIVSIVKNKKVLWEAEIPEAGSCEYDVVTSVKAGDELHFRINANKKNNGWDTVVWWPTVDYLGVEYVPDVGTEKYYSVHADELTLLEYDESTDAYWAADGLAFISEGEVMPNDDYSLMRRFTIKEDGRYRVLGTILPDNINGCGIEMEIYKNGEMVWAQMFPETEEGIVDVRMMASAEDTVDVVFSTNEYEGFNKTKVSLDVKKYVGTMFCTASTSVGTSFGSGSTYTLSSFIGSSQNQNAECYSLQYDVKHPLTYNSASKRWEDKWEGHAFDDKGFISAESVNTGHLADICVDVKLPESGTIKLTGKLPVSSASDGVLTKLYKNGELIWSSRVGGERSVRWDEPYDTSYFINEINAAANVSAGDILTFRFGRWRINSNDETNIEDIKITYVRGSVLSDTTAWKLNRSIVADTQNRCVMKNGEKKSIDVILHEGKTYIERQGAKELFGAESAAELLQKDGREYVSLRETAEANGRAVVWAADRLAIVHEGIPVMFGWPELSEIKTVLEQGGDLFD